MPDVIRQLLLTETALEKLGARSITAEQAEQLLHNEHLTVRNPRAARASTRRLLVGRTNGGRSLTLVIEQTIDGGSWLIVTGWASTEAERKLLNR